MDLELELRIAQTRDSHTSNIQIKKDNSPVFSHKETESMFFLIGNLPGLEKENIKIEIDNGGKLITISGDKSVQETVLVTRAVYKRIGTKGFKMVFRIPEGINLDRIRARFEDDGILVVSMPKLSPGKIQGILIEEVKTDDVDSGDRETGFAIEVAKEKVAGRPVTEESNETPATELTEESSKKKQVREEYGVGIPEENHRELQMPEDPLVGEEQKTRVSERKRPEVSAVEAQGEEFPDQEQPQAPVLGEEQETRVSEKEMLYISSTERQQELPDQEEPAAPAVGEEQELGVSEHEISEASAMGTQEEFLDQDVPEAPAEEEGQEFGVSEKEMPEASIEETQNVQEIPDQEKLAAVEKNQELESPVPEMPAAIETQWSREKEDIHLGTEEQDQDITPMNENPDPDIAEFQVLEAPATKIPEVPNNSDLGTHKNINLEPAKNFPETKTPEASSSGQNQEPEKSDSELPKVELPVTPLIIREKDQRHPEETSREPSSEQKPDEEVLKIEAQEPTPNQEHKLEVQEQRKGGKPLEIEMNTEEQLPQMEIPDQEAPEMEIRQTRNPNKRDKSTQTPPGAPFCIPCIFASSAFIVSLIVLAMHLLRNKR